MDDAPGFIRRRGTDVDLRRHGGGFGVGVCFDSLGYSEVCSVTYRRYLPRGIAVCSTEGKYPLTRNSR